MKEDNTILLVLGEASLEDKTLYQTTARGPMCPYHYF